MSIAEWIESLAATDTPCPFDPELFRACDFEKLTPLALQEPFAAVSKRHAKEIQFTPDGEIDWSEPPGIEAIRSEVFTAFMRVKSRGEFAAGVMQDVDLVLRVWLSGVHDRWVNGIWVAYRAGVSPWSILRPIDQPAEELTDISCDHARSLLDLPPIAELTGPRIPPLPPVEVLESQLRQCSTNNWYTEDIIEGVIVDPSRIPAGWQVPEPWVALLKAQSQDGPDLSWEPFWGEWKVILPSIWDFLTTQCIGVALLKMIDLPIQLVYFAPDSHPYPGMAWLSCRVGRMPCGEPPSGSPLGEFPSWLRDYCTRQHDGWSTLFGDGGLWPCGIGTTRIGDNVSNASCFGEGPRLFDVDRVFPIADFNGAGDYLCVNLTNSPADPTTCGLLYWHETPAESEVGRDLGVELNKLINWGRSLIRVRSDRVRIGMRVGIKTGEFTCRNGVVTALDPDAGRVAVRFEDQQYWRPPLAVVVGFDELSSPEP